MVSRSAYAAFAVGSPSVSVEQLAENLTRLWVNARGQDRQVPDQAPAAWHVHAVHVIDNRDDMLGAGTWLPQLAGRLVRISP